MNRIILIGNGFDIAHGLKTKYSDFLDDYWKNEIEYLRKEKPSKTFIRETYTISFDEEIDFSNLEVQKKENYEYLKNFLYKKRKVIGILPIPLPDGEIFNEEDYKMPLLSFKNKLFKDIMDKEKWVDIEDEYYQNLKAVLKSGNENKIANLNQEFHSIKSQLIKYIKKIDDEQLQNMNNKGNYLHNKHHILSSIIPKVWSAYQFDDFSNEGVNRLIEDYRTLYFEYKVDKDKNSELSEFMKIDWEHQDDEKLKEVISERPCKYPDKILFLNFNYTNTHITYKDELSVELYSKIPILQSPQTEVIHIHGNIQYQKSNPIIFSFGDERDDSYAEIEKNRNDEYLKNIKSIEYLKTDNYRKLLNFLMSDNYQVFIMGHSCGVSDRTLLSTIFEHENCCSVKFFYHQWQEKESCRTEDNYLEVIKNISRNFSNKAMLRDRVVNKSYTEPLA